MTTKNSTYKVTDTISGVWMPVELDDFELIVGGWFPEAPAEVLNAVRELEQHLRAGTPSQDLESFLALKVEGWAE